MTNVVVPMAGAGSRFAEAGYELPKFLIDVKGMPMAKRAIWGSGIGGRVIYIVQAEHNKKYNLAELFPDFTPELEVMIVEVDGITEGAAATVLAAKEHIDSEELLVICDPDGAVEWEPNEFLVDVGEGRGLDGAIATFRSQDPKFSYAKADENLVVSEVSEKDPISEHACAGVYYWRHGYDFVKYAEQMISEDKRVNGEFYVAPVYNAAIADGAKVGIYEVNDFHSMGTPEELEAYMQIVEPWVDERPSE
jgi:dTDP-glucose pyrophosphorylase